MFFTNRQEILGFFSLIIMFSFAKQFTAHHPICPRKYDKIFTHGPCDEFEYHPKTGDLTGNLLAGSSIIMGDQHDVQATSTIPCMAFLYRELPWSKHPSESTRFLFEMPTDNLDAQRKDNVTDPRSKFCNEPRKQCVGWDDKNLRRRFEKLVHDNDEQFVIRNLFSLYKVYKENSFKAFFETERLRKVVCHWLLQHYTCDKQLHNQTEIVEGTVDTFGRTMRWHKQTPSEVFDNRFASLKESAKDAQGRHGLKLRAWKSYSDWKTAEDTGTVRSVHFTRVQSNRTRLFFKRLKIATREVETPFGVIGSNHLGQHGAVHPLRGNRNAAILVRKRVHDVS